ncbi:nitrate ABC transporter substrate-binding protein [Acetobacter pasteurianus]|uniref:ABC transporter substrate-binding protein n=1 Tax=Acetobacter pasteurianus TaxID=438 RepID=UPI0002D51849|nr:ABC transporter substrate-binding protein [Acetobacter pasteurianus]RCL10170.1 nitrate ABC transporter substrate-binding protein [Acetobacter pasteurianus]GCD50272.1 nitrate/sulfonate/bicarbonate transporter substrate-binding periplasmic protein [Acetobacter pasteurianus subsp. pasteurianus LMG 1262 = NBRC 106471]
MSAQGPSQTRRNLLLAGMGGIAAIGGGTFLTTRGRHHPHKQPDGTYRQIKIGWPNSGSAPVLAVAAQKDFFAHYSLDVDLPFATINGEDTINALARGDIPYAVAPALTWLRHLYSGLNAQLLIGVQPGNFRLLVRRSSRITRLDQLMGRTVAVMDQNAADKLFFAIMMRRKGLDAMNRINWLDLPLPQIDDAVRSQRIDAVVAHDYQAWWLLQSFPDLFIELAGSNTGHYAERTSMVLGASSSVLQDDPDAAIALVLALRDAARWTDTHRDDAATLIAPDISDLSAASIRAMLHSEPAIRPVIGKSLREQLAQYCDELQLVGLMPETEDSAALARRYARNVLKE